MSEADRLYNVNKPKLQTSSFATAVGLSFLLLFGYVLGYVIFFLLSGDGGESWQRAGRVSGTGNLQRVTLHPGPLRASSLRLRLQGRGACTLYSVSVLYGKGSEER